MTEQDAIEYRDRVLKWDTLEVQRNQLRDGLRVFEAVTEREEAKCNVRISVQRDGNWLVSTLEVLLTDYEVRNALEPTLKAKLAKAEAAMEAL